MVAQRIFGTPLLSDVLYQATHTNGLVVGVLYRGVDMLKYSFLAWEGMRFSLDLPTDDGFARFDDLAQLRFNPCRDIWDHPMNRSPNVFRGRNAVERGQPLVRDHVAKV